MKLLQSCVVSGVVFFSSLSSAFANSGYGYGNDNIGSTIGRAILWLHVVSASVMALYVISHIKKIRNENKEVPRAKKHVVMGLMAMGGVMVLRGFMNLVQYLTVSSVMVGF